MPLRWAPGADGSGEFTKAIGMEFDLSARGLGVRSQRYSMLVDDGVVKTINLEKPGAFEVSDANTLLAQM
jgi:glutaredoxin/glutathione-dependent peroxiredoxin